VPEYLSIPTASGSFDAIADGPADGRPVLLLHGFPEAGVEWSHQVAALGAEGFRAVAPDQRGYSPGVRPERPTDYAIDLLVGDVVAIADELGWERLDLVGHDWGGAVAWWTADAHPDRLRSLSVVSTPHPAALGEALRSDEEQRMMSQYMTDWREKSTERRMLADDAAALRAIFDRRVEHSRVEEYIQRLSEPGALTAALNWYRSGKPPTKAGRISVPTLYVWSTEDVALGSVAALGTAGWVDGPYRFEMIEDVSHWVPEEAPELLTGLLLEHLHSY
jgi:pimeloyl-ACP methyl ester carboxylesterase